MLQRMEELLSIERVQLESLAIQLYRERAGYNINHGWHEMSIDVRNRYREMAFQIFDGLEPTR